MLYSLLYPKCIIVWVSSKTPDKYLLNKVMFYSSARYMCHDVIEYQTSCLAVSPGSVINHMHDLGIELKFYLENERATLEFADS